MTVADRFDFDDFTLVYLRGAGGDFELELTHNHGREQDYDLGDGCGHIAPGDFVPGPRSAPKLTYIIFRRF